MFKHRQRRAPAWAAAALGLGLLAGCQLTSQSQVDGRGRPACPESPQPHLSAAQVADLRLAFARTLEKRGDLAEAEAAYTEALNQDPSRNDTRLRLAVLSDRQAQFQKSEPLYREALTAEADNPDLHCSRGYSLYLQGRWEEAEQSLRRAVALRPDHARAHNNLGLVLSRTDRPDEALKEFQRAGCEPADAHANLAYGLTLAGDWPEARRHYQAALALDPKSPHARKGLQNLNALIKKAGSDVRLVAGKEAGGPPAAAGQRPAATPLPSHFDWRPQGGAEPGR